jgi:hypothetical protein
MDSTMDLQYLPLGDVSRNFRLEIVAVVKDTFGAWVELKLNAKVSIEKTHGTEEESLAWVQLL